LYGRIVTRFTSKEVLELIFAWVSLSMAFSLSFGAKGLHTFAIALLITGSAFVLHELSHKFIAVRYGREAEFRVWWQGIAVALFMAVLTYILFGPSGVFFFAAPGAVYVAPLVSSWRFAEARLINLKVEGMISVAGPLSNFVMCVLFEALSRANLFDLSYVFKDVVFINVYLGLFNMLPVGPLDGRKVLAWSRLVWGVVFSAFLALYVLLG
jgi:Zn-dependent protease